MQHQNGYKDVDTKIKNIQFEKGKNEIRIKWKNIPKAKRYLVYNGETKIYEGTKSELQKLNLKEDEAFNFTIIAFDKDNKQLSSARLITNNKSNKDKLDMSIIVEENKVFLDWSDDIGVKGYKIYKDNVLLTNGSESELEDYSIEKNKEYMYKIVGTTEEQRADGEIADKTFLITVPVKTLEDHNEEIVTEAGVLRNISAYALPEVTNVKHRTFIKKEQIYLWLGECYGGDGSTRSYSPTSGTHRTSYGFDIDWVGRTYTPIRNVGPTRQYNSGANNTCPNTTPVATRTASSDGMTFSQPSVSSSQAFFRVVHSVGNPFWYDTTPNIDYVYDLTIYKNGITMINGSHDGYPWHEIWRYDTSWKQLYEYNPELNGKDPKSLMPPMDVDFGVYK